LQPAWTPILSILLLRNTFKSLLNTLEEL